MAVTLDDTVKKILPWEDKDIDTATLAEMGSFTFLGTDPSDTTVIDIYIWVKIAQIYAVNGKPFGSYFGSNLLNWIHQVNNYFYWVWMQLNPDISYSENPMKKTTVSAINELKAFQKLLTEWWDRLFKEINKTDPNPPDEDMLKLMLKAFESGINGRYNSIDPLDAQINIAFTQTYELFSDFFILYCTGRIIRVDGWNTLLDNLKDPPTDIQILRLAKDSSSVSYDFNDYNQEINIDSNLPIGLKAALIKAKLKPTILLYSKKLNAKPEEDDKYIIITNTFNKNIALYIDQLYAGKVFYVRRNKFLS